VTQAFETGRLRAQSAFPVDDRLASSALARRMAPVVVLVVALHAALLAVPLRSARSEGAPGPLAALQVRFLTAPAVAEPLATPVAAVEQSSEHAVPLPAPMPPTPVDATPAPLIEAAPMAETASATPPLPAIGLVVPGADRDDDFYPRSMLSLAPSPIDMIVIDYPPISDDRGRYVGEATLFIDESGRVVRMRFEGPSLPAALEEAARSAFTNARFRAGEADGRNVKAQIRIEVAFDSRPVDPLPRQRS
jgi:hypothetical protein